MSRLVTPTSFEQAIPGYVSSAHNLATQIVDHVIAGQIPNAWIRAFVSNHSTSHIGDRAEIAKLRAKNSSEMQLLTTTVPTDSGRMMIKDSTLYREDGTRRVDVRIYNPFLQAGSMTAEEVTAVERELKTPDTRSNEDGLQLSNTAKDLGNLIVPGLVFNTNRTTTGPEVTPFIEPYLYPKKAADTGDNISFYPNRFDLFKPHFFINANTPQFTEADATLMDQSLETYVSAKIEFVLNTMAAVIGTVRQ